ncbi:MAG: aminotransferase class IV [Sneathiella sp.]
MIYKKEFTDMGKSHTTHDAEEDLRNQDILIYVNGTLVPRNEAVVSVYDSGFMLGDGMWEGMRLYNGKWAFFDEHMDRLFDSCKAVSLDIGMDRAGVADALQKTAEANGMQNDVHCRLMITRGIKEKPFQHPSLSRSGPTIVIIMEHSKPVDSLLHKGIRLATVPQVRGLPMSQDAKFNSHSKLNCVLACLQAEQVGADEALMLDPHGFVNTTNACNFFIVRKGEVWTSTGDYCMNGVTRQKVIDVCKANGIPVYKKNYSLYEAVSADEAFLTGTFGAQTPVAEIDGKVLGSGEGAGPVTRQIRALYKELIQQNING